MRSSLGLFIYLFVFAVGVSNFHGNAFAQNAAAHATEEDKPFWETENVPDKLVKRYERRLPFFKEMDSNKDWVLQEPEIEAYLLSSFKEYDTDSNGLWDENEQALHSEAFVKDRDEIYGATANKRIKRYTLRIDHADSNEDKNLSWKEYYTFFRDRFYRMDSNGDEEVEYKEFRLIDDKLSPRGGVDSKHIDVPEYK